MTNDDWARERAERLAEEVTWQVDPITGPSAEVFNVVRFAILAALLEAEQRILDRLKEPDRAIFNAGRQAGMSLSAGVAASHRSRRPLHEFDRGATAIANAIECGIRSLAAELAKPDPKHKGGDDGK